jgi:translation initiation factor 2B subunit (eIF-2B alpha/beta/delta family)
MAKIVQEEKYENISAIKKIFQENGFVKIREENKYKEKYGSFAINFQKRREIVLVFCSSKQVTDIYLELECTTGEVCEWFWYEYILPKFE